MPSEPASFPAQTLSFLRDLNSNNNREWFQSHKELYESAVKAPVMVFATALSDRIAIIAPEYATSPEKAVQRIYRDIRFSPDKTPYRTELGMLFAHRSLGKKSGSGIYVSISSHVVLIAGGLYQQDATGLYAIRHHLQGHLATFEKLVSSKAVRQTFGALSGVSLKRPPRGFAPDHPAIELLKQTQWLLEAKLPAETACEPAFLKTISSKIEILLPFVRFFETPLLAKAQPALLD